VLGMPPVAAVPDLNGGRHGVEVGSEHALYHDPLAQRVAPPVQVRVYQLARPVAILGHLPAGR